VVLAPVDIGYTNSVMTALGRTLDRLDRILRGLRRLDTVMSLAQPPYRPTLQMIDHELGERVRGLQTNRGVGCARALTQAGSWVSHVGVMTDGAALARRRADPTLAVASVAAMAGCSGVYTLIKAVLGRERPDSDGHLVRVRDASFPSGHAATAAAAARTLAELHDLPKAPLFVAAACVAGSRVYLGVHHPSDAIAGLVIGWSWASLVASVAARTRYDGTGESGTGTQVDSADTPPGSGRPDEDEGEPSKDQLRARRRARSSGHPVSG
jgi:hypothetical protein